jgi:hypothetical protein
VCTVGAPFVAHLIAHGAKCDERRRVNNHRRARVLSSRSVERASHVEQAWRKMGFRLAFVFVGLFGVAFAISGLLVALPRPAVGGSCGPGTTSESAIVALFDPGSIGAGPEPPATNVADRADWMAFVGECQASADGRVLATFFILVLSLGVAVAGTGLVVMARKRLVAGVPISSLAG